MGRKWAVLLSGCFLAVFPFASCSAQPGAGNGTISSYEECVAAGNRIMKSMPPQCITADGRRFTRGSSTPGLSHPIQPVTPRPERPICRDLCGDGACQEIVCQAEGCPCAESPARCPSDCR